LIPYKENLDPAKKLVVLKVVNSTLLTAAVEFQKTELNPTTKLAPCSARIVLFLVVSNGSIMSTTHAPKAFDAALAPVIASSKEYWLAIGPVPIVDPFP
jgi:hypothetical protein